MTDRQLPDSPIGDADLPALLQPFENRAGVVLAVSGGPDSMALLWLATRWRALGGKTPFHVATIDHGLRTASAAEAAFVADTAARLGLPHRTWRWEGAKPQTRIQQSARDARYALLLQAATEAGCDSLATAHTLDDQAETVLMRLANGSGIDGLAAMRPALDRAGITHLRPLLAIPKRRLVATLAREGIVAIDDPSNGNERFERVRIRRLAQTLEGLGLTSESLARLARRAAEASDALDSTAARFLAADGQTSGLTLTINHSAWQSLDRDLRRRVLALGIRHLAPQDTLIRLERLETLEAHLSASAEPKSRHTLGGVVIDAAVDMLTLRCETGRLRNRRRKDG